MFHDKYYVWYIGNWCVFTIQKPNLITHYLYETAIIICIGYYCARWNRFKLTLAYQLLIIIIIVIIQIIIIIIITLYEDTKEVLQ